MLRLHKDEEFLRSEMAKGRTSRDISKDLHVSYKLVELYLRKYKIPFDSQQTKE